MRDGPSIYGVHFGEGQAGPVKIDFCRIASDALRPLLTTTVIRHGRSEWQITTGGFNRSSQHLLIRADEEVRDGDVADPLYVGAAINATGPLTGIQRADQALRNG